MLLDQKDSARQKPDQLDVPLVLADVTPEVFMSLLEFLYTNTCTLNSKNVSLLMSLFLCPCGGGLVSLHNLEGNFPSSPPLGYRYKTTVVMMFVNIVKRSLLNIGISNCGPSENLACIAGG